MTNDIDDLMDKDPLDYTKDDVKRIVEYHRERRMKMEQGIKPSKAKKDIGPQIQVTLESLGLNKKPPSEPFKRRL